MRASVVVPLFQKAPYLHRCLESLSGQTFADFEVIVVDDGSTDGGHQVVSARGDARFRLIRQENRGESAARNRGMSEARGEWVAFLDADDEWRPEFLERTLGQTESHPELVGVFTNVYDAVSRRALLQEHGGGVLVDYFGFVLENQLGMTAMGTLTRRSALVGCGGFREGRTVDEVGEDQDAFARLAWTGPVAYLPLPLAVYHAGIPHGSTDRARRRPPQMPPRVLSYRELERDGRIPVALAASSRALSEHLLLDYVASLINFGCRFEALRALVAECGLPSLSRWRYWTLVLRVMLPGPLHARLRAQLTRSPSPLSALLSGG